MTLEEQIRRMGEARATKVSTPSWRDRTGEGVGRRWAWAAAAAAVVLAVVGAALLSRETESPTDVADPDPISVARWIPPSGVWQVAYGASPAALFFSVPGQQVALVTTAEDATSQADEDWTWISVGPQPLIFALSEDGDSGPRDGYFEFGTDNGNVLIISERLTADDLAGAETSLRAADGNIDAIATTIAEVYADVDVVYVGSASSPPTQVSSEPDVDGEVVWWIDEPNVERYMATYRWLLNADGNAVDELFAFSERVAMDQDFAAYPADLQLRQVNKTEWFDIITDLLGDNPRVTADQRGGTDSRLGELGLDLASPAAEPVQNADGSWTVRLLFDQPLSSTDGGGIELSIGPRITLSFLFEPGVSHRSNDLIASLAEAEARRYAELINRSVSEPASATTTLRYPTTDPSEQTGVCATNPVPSDDVLDVATHIAFDRTPLDLDQDGIDDEMLIYDDVDGNWWVIAQLQAGWTNALDLGTPPTPPGLAMTSEGVPAGTDLDGDGQLEFFLNGYIGPSAALVTLRECELVDSFFVNEAPEGFGASFGVQIGLSADISACQGTSCATRVRCVGDVLTQELFFGVGPTDLPGSWATAEVRLDPSGVITTTDLPVRTVLPFETLDDPPTEATTGVIDCTP
jgi:hypothetical protein